jgi:hypothetical protein
MESVQKGHDHRGGAIAVAVITTSGIYPDADDYRRAFSEELVSDVLAAAALKLGLTNTSDWIATVENRPIDPAKTFKANDLKHVIEIEWHKKEGGGGA